MWNDQGMSERIKPLNGDTVDIAQGLRLSQANCCVKHATVDDEAVVVDRANDTGGKPLNAFFQFARGHTL